MICSQAVEIEVVAKDESRNWMSQENKGNLNVYSMFLMQL